MCVLRARGINFPVDDFLKQTTLIACEVFRKGQPKASRRQKTGKLLDHSSVNIIVSDADFDDFPTQIQDAITFLKKNRQEIGKLCRYDGVESVQLDFGVEQIEGGFQFEFFPPDLIRRAGQLGLGIELSIYPSSEPEGKRPRSSKKKYK